MTVESITGMTSDELAERHMAWRILSDAFSSAPAATRIKIPEAIRGCLIFGNLDSNSRLSGIAVDAADRLWRHDRDANELVMFFDPHARG